MTFCYLEYSINFHLMKNINGKPDIKNFPPTINRLFERKVTFIFNSCSSSIFKKARGILEIVSASFKPIAVNDLFKYSDGPDKYNMNEYLFHEIIHKMSPHLLRTSENGKITFQHILFKYWLTSEERKGFRCFVNTQNGHRRIANKLYEDLQNDSNEGINSMLVYLLVEHIYESNDLQLINKLKLLSSYHVDKKTC